jgi:plastocyanin
MPVTDGLRRAGYVIGAALALTGCGGGSGGSGGATVVDDVRVAEIIDVHETDFRLTPKTIRIDRFGYYGLRAINDGDVPHALAIEGPGIEKRTKEIAPGSSETMLVFFRRAGSYKLYSPLDGDEQKGMKATVKVH